MHSSLLCSRLSSRGLCDRLAFVELGLAQITPERVLALRLREAHDLGLGALERLLSERVDARALCPHPTEA